MLKSNVVIDMDLTAADISSNSSSIGRAGLVLKLPPVNSKEAPNFSKLVYQAEYNSKTTVLNTDIKITNKKDSDNVIVTIDQDFQRYFSISLNKKTSMWEVTVIALPDSVTRDKQNLVITLTATQTGNTAVGKSTLLVTLPEKNPPQFSQAFYEGSYKIDDGTAKLTMEDFVITNREHSENLLLGIGVFEKNLDYHYDHNKNVWSLNLLAPFSEEQLDNKTEFILTLTAEDTEERSFGRATVIIYLPAKNNPKPVLEFSQFSYEGTYNETEGKPIVNLEKTIEITSKADLKNVQVTLQSPDSFDKYFTLKEESIGHYQIHVTTPLPQSVLEDRTSLILTLEADLDGYKTHATLVINLPAIVINRDIHFSKIVYNGTYKVADGNTTFTVEPIQVTTSAPVEEVFVMISSDPAYKEYFVAQYINKQVVIKSKTELPEKILKTVSLIPLTLEIAIIGKPDRANAVVNIEISYNNPDDKSTISIQ
ncbi:uncharacterized protein [Leptinotarsa decemlineata]|uniref:uncharacterized protein n=1 Tax=Leptinotarsa decemlineata TaxID=7539 RepID=UPI003D30CC27